MPEQPARPSMQRTAATRTLSGGSFGDLNEDLLGPRRWWRIGGGGDDGGGRAGAEQPVLGGWRV